MSGIGQERRDREVILVEVPGVSQGSDKGNAVMAGSFYEFEVNGEVELEIFVMDGQ